MMTSTLQSRCADKAASAPTGQFMSSPAMPDYLASTLAEEQREQFGAAFMDSQHALIAFGRRSMAIFSQISAYPRAKS